MGIPRTPVHSRPELPTSDALVLFATPLIHCSRATQHTPTATMTGEAWLYLLAVLINAVNLFLQVFFTIMYSDLEW